VKSAAILSMRDAKFLAQVSSRVTLVRNKVTRLFHCHRIVSSQQETSPQAPRSMLIECSLTPAKRSGKASRVESTFRPSTVRNESPAPEQPNLCLPTNLYATFPD